MRVAIAHDYLTQRGGAERVVLSMLEAFGSPTLYTSLYDPDGTFPEFAEVDVHALALNRLRALRRHHRLALPILARAFSNLSIEADVVICSSSGWAHGVEVIGRKIVYCYSPARWLYQTEAYLGDSTRVGKAALKTLRRSLVEWDRKSAYSADRYVTLSSAVADRIQQIYGIEAEVVPPPPVLDAEGPQDEIPDLEPGFLLVVSRLLPYKNLMPMVDALERLPDRRLVVVGTGPMWDELRAAAPSNVTFLGSVSDEKLRWLYAGCEGLVAASFEDYGLTPLEAGQFGKPAIALRWGGFLDTLSEGVTGIFFDTPDSDCIADAIRRAEGINFDSKAITDHTDRFSKARFAERMRKIALEESVIRD